MIPIEEWLEIRINSAALIFTMAARSRAKMAPKWSADLMAMSAEEIDAYWDEQERQLEGGV